MRIQHQGPHGERVIFQVSRQPVNRHAIHEIGDRNECVERQLTRTGQLHATWPSIYLYASNGANSRPFWACVGDATRSVLTQLKKQRPEEILLSCVRRVARVGLLDRSIERALGRVGQLDRSTFQRCPVGDNRSWSNCAGQRRRQELPAADAAAEPAGGDVGLA